MLQVLGLQEHYARTELDAARLCSGEEEELRSEQRRLQHAERFTTGITEVTDALRDDESSALARVARAAAPRGSRPMWAVG